MWGIQPWLEELPDLERKCGGSLERLVLPAPSQEETHRPCRAGTCMPVQVPQQARVGGGSEVAEMTGRCFSRSLVFAGCPTNVWLQEREKKLEHRVRKHNPSGDFAVTEVKRFLGHGPWQNMVRGEKWLTMCPCFQVLFLLLVLSCFFLQGVIWGKLYRSRG